MKSFLNSQKITLLKAEKRRAKIGVHLASHAYRPKLVEVYMLLIQLCCNIASRSAYWQISKDSCLSVSDSLTPFVVMIINKTVSCDRMFQSIWQILVSIARMLSLWNR